MPMVLKNKEHKLNFIPPKTRTIELFNKDIRHHDFGKKIDLQKLCESLKENNLFVPSYDLDSNPFQNYIQIDVKGLNDIEGSFWIYANGTARTNIGVHKDYLCYLTIFLYNMYIKDNFKVIK